MHIGPPVGRKENQRESTLVLIFLPNIPDLMIVNKPYYTATRYRLLLRQGGPEIGYHGRRGACGFPSTTGPTHKNVRHLPERRWVHWWCRKMKTHLVSFGGCFQLFHLISCNLYQLILHFWKHPMRWAGHHWVPRTHCVPRDQVSRWDLGGSPTGCRFPMQTKSIYIIYIYIIYNIYI